MKSRVCRYFRFEDVDKKGFIIALQDSDKISHAENILSGKETAKVHISGTIVKESSFYNPDWCYHLDPDSIDFFELSMEVCDASMGYVGDHLDEVGGSTLPNNFWCPWSSYLVEEVLLSKIIQPLLRSFPNLNTNKGAILTGGGGGFTQRFTDFIIGTSGGTDLVTYETDTFSGDIINLNSSPLLSHENSKKVEKLFQSADDIDFFQMQVPSPQSMMIRRTAISHPTLGEREIVWDEDNAPTDLVQFDKRIRNFLSTAFTTEHGS